MQEDTGDLPPRLPGRKPHPQLQYTYELLIDKLLRETEQERNDIIK